MSLKEIKTEIEYYTGNTPTEAEVEEIAFYVNSGAGELSQIVSDYYGC